MQIANDTTRVTDRTVVWSIKLVSGKDGEPNHLAMGVGWSTFIDMIKHMRCKANEDHGDVLQCTWTGSGAKVYQFIWHSQKDAPALLPAPSGIELDNPTDL